MMGRVIEGMGVGLVAVVVVVTSTPSQFLISTSTPSRVQPSTLDSTQPCKSINFPNLARFPAKAPCINTIRHDREIRNSSPTHHISVEITACKRTHNQQATPIHDAFPHSLRDTAIGSFSETQHGAGANVTDHKHRPNSSSPRVSGKNGSSGTRFSLTVLQ